MYWRDHISADPAVCHGQTCIKGTRVMVSVVLDNLAAGMGPVEVVMNYPTITVDDVRAAMAYAAALAHERVLTIPA